ncbi:MAG: hypothetical protein ACE5I2_07260 [Anaerolineae bacterium]
MPLARELLDLSRRTEEAMRSHPLGREAAIIGQVAESLATEQHPGSVILRSRVGGKRVVWWTCSAASNCRASADGDWRYLTWSGNSIGAFPVGSAGYYPTRTCKRCRVSPD